MNKTLLKYLPEQSIPLVIKWFEEYQFHLRISKKRQTKLGDFRPAQNGKPNRISVNGDLNPFHFLITLTHEVAHASTWIKHTNRVAPHGKEWQRDYSALLNNVIQEVSFPDELKAELHRHIQKPKASSCSDPELYKALKKLDSDQEIIYLEQLDEGILFQLHGKRVFVKGKKRRSRYECIDQKNGKTYLVSAHAEVQSITSTSNN